MSQSYKLDTFEARILVSGCMCEKEKAKRSYQCYPERKQEGASWAQSSLEWQAWGLFVSTVFGGTWCTFVNRQDYTKIIPDSTHLTNASSN